MKLLNVGCGGQRPGEPWTNLDCLRQFLKEGTPERTNLDKETNYVEANLLDTMPLPFPVDTFDGILIQHVIEHLTCHEAVHVLADCRRVLKPRGICVVSVPNCAYFLEHFAEDNKENAVRVFGEPISEPQYERFFDYALFHREHKQLLTRQSLLCHIIKAGFSNVLLSPFPDPVMDALGEQLNRLKFSAIIHCQK